MIGAKVNIALKTAEIERLRAFDEFMEIEDAQGERIYPRFALGASVMVGTVSAAIELTEVVKAMRWKRFISAPDTGPSWLSFPNSPFRESPKIISDSP